MTERDEMQSGDDMQPTPIPSEQPELPEGYEQEVEEAEQPRRAASAEFVVDAELGSTAALREAMDPANQSLADALRLSYRVLQFVMVVLVFLFLTSGVKVVENEQSGVRLVFGGISDWGGNQVLGSGAHINLPQPLGEFVLFRVEGRGAGVGEDYMPVIPPTVSRERAVEAANENNPLRPVNERTQEWGDGYLLTAEGDFAHLRVRATYQVDDPVGFVNSVKVEQADQLVSLALKQAVVHVVASQTLEETRAENVFVTEPVKNEAQRLLDDLRSGIRLVSVTLPDKPAPPLAIEKALTELQSARVAAEESIENARDEANRILVGMAGENHEELTDLVAEYESAVRNDDQTRAEEVIAAFNAKLESEDIAGTAKDIVERARAYRSQVELTLGVEARRFAGLLPAYRENPHMVVRQRWLEAYATVLNQDDVEIIVAPPGLGRIDLALSGSDEVAQIRRRNRLERREQEALRGEGSPYGPGGYLMRGSDIQLSGPGRQIRREDLDKVRNLGQGNNQNE